KWRRVEAGFVMGGGAPTGGGGGGKERNKKTPSPRRGMEPPNGTGNRVGGFPPPAPFFLFWVFVFLRGHSPPPPATKTVPSRRAGPVPIPAEGLRNDLARWLSSAGIACRCADRVSTPSPREQSGGSRGPSARARTVGSCPDNPCAGYTRRGSRVPRRGRP